MKWNQKFPPSALPLTRHSTVRPLSNNVTLPKRSTVTFAHSQPHLHHLALVQTPLTARCPPSRQRSAGGVADGFFSRTECDKMTKSRTETLSDGSSNPSMRHLMGGSLYCCYIFSLLSTVEATGDNSSSARKRFFTSKRSPFLGTMS